MLGSIKLKLLTLVLLPLVLTVLITTIVTTTLSINNSEDLVQNFESSIVGEKKNLLKMKFLP